MQDRPSTTNIIDTVTLFLRDLMSRTDGSDKFHLRVAIHLLDIVEREWKLSYEQNQKEHSKLSELLHQEGSLKELNALLAKNIRDGSINFQDERVFKLLIETLEDKLRIVNPDYLAKND